MIMKTNHIIGLMAIICIFASLFYIFDSPTYHKFRFFPKVLKSSSSPSSPSSSSSVFSFFSHVFKQFSNNNIIMNITTTTTTTSFPFNKTKSISRTQCGESNHNLITRPCKNNDTNCGYWVGRYFHHHSCDYRDITPKDARKCIGNHTLAFIGDSHIQDIGYSLALFLLEVYKLKTAPNRKLERKHDVIEIASVMPNFDIWDNIPNQGNGMILPQAHNSYQQKIFYQIQVWALHNNLHLDTKVFDILNNRMPQYWPALHKIDFAFWSHGLHDIESFHSPPYGKKFYDQIVSKWNHIRLNVTVPSVWVSLNQECREKRLRRKQSAMNDANAVNDVAVVVENEDVIIDEANRYTNHITKQNKIPYWDASSVQRTKERCNISDEDGIHVKIYVDIMRAKMLFNHLCDENMEWRGSVNRFI